MFGCSAADAEVDSAAGAATKGAVVKSVDGTSPLSCPKTTEAKSVQAPKIVRFIFTLSRLMSHGEVANCSAVA